MKTIGANDYMTDPVTGVLSYGKFRIFRIPINNPTGRTDWPFSPYNRPLTDSRVLNTDYYFYKLYEWNFDIGYLSNTQLPDNFTVGNYNDNLVITLETGYIYYFSRTIFLPPNLSQSTGIFPISGSINDNPIITRDLK